MVKPIGNGSAEPQAQASSESDWLYVSR